MCLTLYQQRKRPDQWQSFDAKGASGAELIVHILYFMRVLMGAAVSRLFKLCKRKWRGCAFLPGNFLVIVLTILPVVMS